MQLFLSTLICFQYLDRSLIASFVVGQSSLLDVLCHSIEGLTCSDPSKPIIMFIYLENVYLVIPYFCIQGMNFSILVKIIQKMFV